MNITYFFSYCFLFVHNTLIINFQIYPQREFSLVILEWGFDPMFLDPWNRFPSCRLFIKVVENKRLYMIITRKFYSSVHNFRCMLIVMNKILFVSCFMWSLSATRMLKKKAFVESEECSESLRGIRRLSYLSIYFISHSAFCLCH